MTLSGGSYTERWKRCKRLGLVRECAILSDNEITGRGAAVGITAIVLAIVLLAVGISTAVSLNQCSTFGSQYHASTHWTPFAGCYVRLADGRSVQTGQIRATELLNVGKR